MGPNNKTPACVYYQYDLVGSLLYIGYTSHLGNRTKSHINHSSWGHEIASIAYFDYPNRTEAYKNERESIARLRPPHNSPPRSKKVVQVQEVGRNWGDLDLGSQEEIREREEVAKKFDAIASSLRNGSYSEAIKCAQTSIELAKLMAKKFPQVILQINKGNKPCI